VLRSYMARGCHISAALELEQKKFERFWDKVMRVRNEGRIKDRADGA